MSNKKNKIIIGITMGDYNGIGPEIVLKSIKDFYKNYSVQILIIGSKYVFDQISAQLKYPIKYKVIKNIVNVYYNNERINLLDCFEDYKIKLNLGSITKEAGFFAAKCIEKGVELALNKDISCLVTAPISKESIALAGYRYPGHTEMLSFLTKNSNYLMVLLAENFRVALVTTHCSVAEINKNISIEKIINKVEILNNSLKSDFGIEKPQIGVSALNPHASDGGLFGDEEEKIIIPALQYIQSKGILTEGPFPADSLFAKEKKYDAYLVMYHDQGLIPLKMKSFGKGVNFTAGLPIIRTSPDHGTAYEIADKFVANSDSMLEAIKLGFEFAKKRIYS